MRQLRKEHKSIVHWLTNLVPSFVNVTYEYPLAEELSLPTMAVESSDINYVPFQLGSDYKQNRRWSIYIFAQNIGQRDDYLDIIMDNLDDPIDVYNYDQGEDETSIDKIGYLLIESRSGNAIRVYKDLVKKLYWYGVVHFKTEFDAYGAG